LIVCADSLLWMLEARGEFTFDLILTDPPHLDDFESPEEYRKFVRSWVPEALNLLGTGGILFHSCGPDPIELAAYLEDRLPDQILVWPHEPWYVGDRETRPHLFARGHHFFLMHRMDKTPILWSGSTAIPLKKPDPLWHTIISALVPPGAIVLDPFCGRGEIPLAAWTHDREYLGIEILPESVEYCHQLGL